MWSPELYQLFSMGDPSLVSTPSRNSEVPSVIAGKKGSKTNYVASAPKAFPRRNHRQVALLSCGKIGGGAAGHVAIFLLKVAALETVRRVSRAKCPFIWRGIQALQVICYPPFKLIQRWSPFKGLIRGMQVGYFKILNSLETYEFTRYRLLKFSYCKCRTNIYPHACN